MSTVETIDRDEWLVLLGMVADIRAELEGIHDLLREEEDGQEEADEDS